MQQSDCRWVLAALGKSEFGLYGVVGGMTVIVMLVFTMNDMFCSVLNKTTPRPNTGGSAVGPSGWSPRCFSLNSLINQTNTKGFPLFKKNGGCV